MPRRIFQGISPVKSKYIVLTRELILPGAIIISVIILWWIVFQTSALSIRTVECNLDHEPCTNTSIIAELDKLKGENILELDTAIVEKRLVSSDFTIREAAITKLLPSVVKVELQSVYPVVAIKLEGTSKYLIFDENKRLLGEKNRDPNVPTLVVNESLELAVGQPVSGDLATALDLARAVSRDLPDTREIKRQNDSDIEVNLGTNRMALLTTHKSLDEQLSVLRAILGNDTMIQGVRTIDVRYSQPVLKK